MSKLDCCSCTKLSQMFPDVQPFDFTEEMCDGLSEDVGLNSGVLPTHNDEQDLNTMNDCLVCGLQETINTYESCDWRGFFKQLIPNFCSMFRAIICAIGGVWTNIHNLWKDVNELKLQLDGKTFRTYRYTVPKSKFVKSTETTGGEGMVWWFSGAPDVAECYIEIPIGTMKTVTCVFAQPEVVGMQVKPVTVAIQSYKKVGDVLQINFDTYEFSKGGSVAAPFAVPIDFLVLGTR